MEGPPGQRVEIVVPARTLWTVLAFAVLVVLAILSLGTLLSILIAGVVALGLDPIVDALVRRRGWRRGRAGLFVYVALVLAVGVVVIITIRPLWDEVTNFVDRLPAYWDKIADTEPIKTLLSQDNKGSVHSALDSLLGDFPEAATTVLGVFGGVVGALLSLVTLFFLSLFFLMERPKITDWLFGFAHPEVEARWRPVLERSIRVISASLIGNVVISVVAAIVAGVSAWIFGLPFPIVLAVITGLLDLIPQVGATLAAIILVLVGLTVSTPAAIAMAVVQLVYQQIENYVVYPIVYKQAVSLTPLTTIGVVLIFGTLLGVVGAILAVPFAAVIKTVLREAGAPRRARMAALREATEREKVPA
jgi:predicted PurR-regulated permease PerM